MNETLRNVLSAGVLTIAPLGGHVERVFIRDEDTAMEFVLSDRGPAPNLFDGLSVERHKAGYTAGRILSAGREAQVGGRHRGDVKF